MSGFSAGAPRNSVPSIRTPYVSCSGDVGIQVSPMYTAPLVTPPWPAIALNVRVNDAGESFSNAVIELKL
jgi:hypothetical protein